MPLRKYTKELCTEVDYALTRAIGDYKLKIHSLKSRVKSSSSFRQKLLLKTYANPMSEMHDIVGVRIVCLFRDDVNKVDEIIRKTFDVVKHDDKEHTSLPEMWKYISVHYDCKFGPEYHGTRYDRIKDLIFEIQVRTILQDAWATVEHYLGYKGEHSIPYELKRDFSALVGLFHVADKTFQQIYNVSQELDGLADSEVKKTPVDLHSSGGLSAESELVINRSTVKALLRQLYEDRAKDRALYPESEYSLFVEELAAVGITQVSELQRLLLEGKEDAERAEAADLPKAGYFIDVGFARLTMDILMPEFRETRKRLRV